MKTTSADIRDVILMCLTTFDWKSCTEIRHYGRQWDVNAGRGVWDRVLREMAVKGEIEIGGNRLRYLYRLPSGQQLGLWPKS